MAASKIILPGLVFGLSESGFGLATANCGVGQQAKNDFLSFAKSISWRPKKLEADTPNSLAIVPSEEGVIVCRLSEDTTDIFGRRLAMRVEGILTPPASLFWVPLANIANWPRSLISEWVEFDPEILSAGQPAVTIGWPPESKTPLIFACRELINAPIDWLARPGTTIPE